MRPKSLITMKWVTISAGTGTMKLARIIHQKKRRPGNRAAKSRSRRPLIAITSTVIAAEVTNELRYQ